MGKHLEQALPSVYTLQCLTGKVDNNNNNNNLRMVATIITSGLTPEVGDLVHGISQIALVAP